MSASIILQIKRGIPERTPGNRVGFPCTLTATGDEMPSEIFIYQQQRQGAPSDETVYNFSHVASLPELAYPVETADPEAGLPWMRSDNAKVYHRTQEEMEQFIGLVGHAVGQLVDAVNAPETIETRTYS